MLLSRRPTGVAFFATVTLIAFFTVAVLYQFWTFDLRPTPEELHSRPVESQPQSSPEESYSAPAQSKPTPSYIPSTPEKPIETPAQSQAAPTPIVPSPAPVIGIPKKIWYKLGPAGLKDDAKNWTETCTKPNPDYKYEFMTDLSADVYVMDAFSSRPDIVETYLNLTIPILKADFLRYLLLFDKGGIWSDLDVSCEGTPIDDWVPHQYKAEASLVVGWEFDVGWGDNFIRQFTSWTIMAKPGTKFMAQVIDDILSGLNEKAAENNATIASLTLPMVGDVVDITGPRRLTTSVLKSLEQSLGMAVPVTGIANLMEPRLTGDLLVMPGYSFALSANKYGDAKLPGKPLVTHHYAGTWKNDHGGEETRRDALKP